MRREGNRDRKDRNGDSNSMKSGENKFYKSGNNGGIL